MQIASRNISIAVKEEQLLVATADGQILEVAGGPGKKATPFDSIGEKGLKNAANIAKPMDYGHSVIQAEQLKDALRTEQFTSIIGVTKHGLQRLIERNFTSEEVLNLVKNPDFLRIQTDGAIARITKVGERYNLLVINETSGEVITALRKIDIQALVKQGKNYGWIL